MKQIRQRMGHNQKGFTLIELLIATALVGMITAAFSQFFFHIVRTDQVTNNRVIAVRNLDTAGNWLVLDFQAAQTLPPVLTLSPGTGSMTIYQSVEDMGDSVVTYSINSNKDLCRTVGATTTKVAQNVSGVSYTTGTASTPSALTVTETVGTSQFSKTFKIASRISTSNAQLTILTPSLPDGDVGVPYYQTIMAYGGSLPYNYEITSGALPVWVTSSILADGEIAGSYPTLGTSDFTVKVTDGVGNQVSRDYSIRINPAMSDIITPESLTTGFVGDPYAVQFQIFSGGSSPFYWYSPGLLPPGLDINLNGLLSGTPTTVGTTSFTVVVTDAAGDTRTATRSLNVIPIPACFTAASVFSDEQFRVRTVVTPHGGPYPVKTLDIVARPRNSNYQAVIHCSIKNMTSDPIKILGATLADGSAGVISVAYGGVLAGATSILPGQTDTSGTITLTASHGGGPYTIVVSYVLN
jgi:prepilin-type N-terminal cleavage/methylation domain-containing protein